MGRRELPPLGRVWVGARFALDIDPDQDQPEIYAPAGETPLLTLPEGLTPERMDTECAAAIARLFYQWYGEEQMIRCIRSWPAIVSYVGDRAGDMAAD
jgi:hypothetical protein